MKDKFLFHTMISLTPLPNFELVAVFAEGFTKRYNVEPLFKEIPALEALRDEKLFYSAHLSPGGYAVIWNEVLDLSGEEIWYNGETVETAFDQVMALGDASKLWGLNESTLRKAVASGKLLSNIDARKFGKQWLVTRAAMEREYGELAAS